MRTNVMGWTRDLIEKNKMGARLSKGMKLGRIDQCCWHPTVVILPALHLDLWLGAECRIGMLDLMLYNSMQVRVDLLADQNIKKTEEVVKSVHEMWNTHSASKIQMAFKLKSVVNYAIIEVSPPL